MPYRWTEEPAPGTALPWRLRLWPHRSLSRAGFAAFVGTTAVFLALPLLALIGSPVVWGLLPFLGLVLWLLWWALERSYADAGLSEELVLWSDRIEIIRRDPRGREQRWTANPYFVRVVLRHEGGPVENYLTLAGGGREVELGAFLTPDERVALHETLQAALAAVR
ncbi:MAG: DUF2244 domain-containing protein [Rhodobacteraceae bacterium]|nr:DUF2244 domain-containing protein [Paracoccaceae bacterium]